MPIISKKTKKGFIWIPRPLNYNWKILINSTDVTADLLNVEFVKALVTQEIGRFRIKLDNNGETYTTLFSGGMDIKIYLDYAPSATTLRYYGTLENLKKTFDDTGNAIILEGVHVSGSLLDRTVTESYTNTEISTILTELITDYASGFTSTNVSSNTTTATVNWENKPFFECIVDLCNIVNWDCYVDDSKDFHFFEKDSNECTEDAVVWRDNMLEVSGFGEDTLDVKNKVIVYGQDESGLPIIATSEDSDSQSSYGIKEKIIKDTAIQTHTDAQARADAEIILLNSPETKGNVKSFGLIFVNPGDKVWISNPLHHILNQYRFIRMIHKIDMGMFTTESDVAKAGFTLPAFFRERLSREIATEVIENPNKMTHSYAFSFNSDVNIASHSNTETSEGKLKLVSGETDGTMVTDTLTADSDIAYIELKVSGEDLTSSVFYISVNGGLSYEEVTRNTLHTVLGSGKYLKIKVNLISDSDAPSPEIESSVCLYKS